MKIAFFEIENWAREDIKKSFPEAVISSEKLSAENVSYYSSVEIIATFIYSSLKKNVLSALPNLKCIATMSTGFDHIDIEYCKDNNITVYNVPAYGERTVAEHTFGLILTLTRKLFDSIERTRRGSFSIVGLRGVDLYGKTIGVIGLGKIGAEVVKIARAFGMEVLVYTRRRNEKMARELGFKNVTLDELVSLSDVVTLHLPYSPETRHIINVNNIVNFKKNSYLINTSRGGLVESEAIFIGLEKEILAGVGLDVIEEELVLKEEAELLSSEFRKSVNYESLVYDHLLLRHPKVVVTPHNAFNSVEALRRILHITIDNINFFKIKLPVRRW